jgi:branched-chain amino acid aminotransferase
MQYYSNGVDVITSKQRKDSRSPISSVKTLSFLPYIAARREAHTAIVHDALLLNEADRIAEASTSNIFALHEGQVYAPGEEEGAIPGVTRGAVLDLLEGRGLRIRERLTTTTLHKAEEAWLTNTTGGIVPIKTFQDRPIGAGGRGKLTAELSRLLEAQIRGGKA